MGNNQKQDDEADGKGGKGGTGGKGGSGFIPSFDELVAVTPEEAELAGCAKDALFSNRVDLKSKGEKVAALDKKQELRKKLSDPRIANELGGGGSNLEEHPLLADLGGLNDIEFPEIEAEAAAANNPELSNKLRAQMKFGASADAIRYNEENKKKAKLTMSSPGPAPEQRPEYVIRPAAPPPRPRPAGF